MTSRIWALANGVSRGLRRPPAIVSTVARSAIFMMKMLPIPSGAIDRITERPAIETRWFAARSGRGEADLYRPPGRDPHPGVLCILGVVPAGVEHPLVTRLGEGLARSGFAALLYRSTTMRDLQLDPGDVDELESAYETLTRQPYVDAGRSGILGVCVGASFALMTAASPSIRDRVTFVFAYAPYSSMWTLAVDITSGTRTLGDVREKWDVDPLTWQTYVRSVTAWLPSEDSRRLRDAHEDRIRWNDSKTAVVRSAARLVDANELSEEGRATLRLLSAGADDVESALRGLPPAAKQRLTTLSPINYLSDIAAPRIMLLHDRNDHVIPVGESRRLWSALSRRPGVTYTEMGLQHLRKPQGLPPLRLLHEIAKTYLAWYPLFRATA